MTELTSMAIGSASGMGVIADLAEQAASREILELVDGQRIGVVLNGDQRIHEIDLQEYASGPSRKKGSVALVDVDSLVTYTSRHLSSVTTTLWADLDKGSVTTVFDDHSTEADAGWGTHRAVLSLKATEDWTHWLKYNGQMISQEKFAEHLEDGVDAIREPSAAHMLEVAQSFQAKRGVQFKSGNRLNSGEVQFQYDETIQAKAGQRGDITIPESFTLGLAPFEGNDPYALTARFRYRLHEGALTLGYRLVRPDKVRKAAFEDVLKSIADGVGLPILAGTPRA